MSSCPGASLCSGCTYTHTWNFTYVDIQIRKSKERLNFNSMVADANHISYNWSTTIPITFCDHESFVSHIFRPNDRPKMILMTNDPQFPHVCSTLPQKDTKVWTCTWHKDDKVTCLEHICTLYDRWALSQHWRTISCRLCVCQLGTSGPRTTWVTW